MKNKKWLLSIVAIFMSAIFAIASVEPGNTCTIDNTGKCACRTDYDSSGKRNGFTCVKDGGDPTAPCVCPADDNL